MDRYEYDEYLRECHERALEEEELALERGDEQREALNLPSEPHDPLRAALIDIMGGVK